MTRNVPDDIKDLVMTEEELVTLTKAAEKSPAAKKRLAKLKSRFIKFPEEWQFQLARMGADGCTYRVALYLLQEAWRTDNNRVKLANVALKQRNVSRWSKQRALDQLGDAGLISTERQSRKSPIVTVKFVD